MKKWILDFVVLLLLVSLGLIGTLKMNTLSFCRMFSADCLNNFGLNQNSLVANAYIYIEHTYLGDLVVDLGVGYSDKPDWAINIWNEEEDAAESLNLTIDISEANQYLPPSESNRWFLKVYDAGNENLGEIHEFTITHNGQTYASTCIPVPIYDLQTSFSYIPGVPLELAMARRMSIREFPSTENYTLPEVSGELLSKVLWAGYGPSSWGRTIPSICGSYPLVIYVCNKTAVYRYNPEERSLDLWKEGDHRFAKHTQDYPGPGAHRAPIELFITLDMNKSTDIYLGAMEAGCIIQNIYLEANSLGLGTVCVGGVDREAAHNVLDLPANEYVLYNMPLGHPQSRAFYNFTSINVSRPPASRELPQVKQGSVFLNHALMERKTAHDWTENPLTRQEISQILWSAYGSSYLKDMRPSFWSFQWQHRTVPSAHGRYPLTIWMANSTGIYVYYPYYHRIFMKIEGDKRAEIAEAAGENWMASAPTMLVVVWNSTKLERQDWAYSEIGFVIQNVHLESVAWGLAADWSKIVDGDAMKAVLGLVEQTDLHPITVITVGHPSKYQHKVPWNGMTYTVSVFTNSCITNFGDKTISFNVTGPSGTVGFCNVTLPKEMLYRAFTVLIDGTPLDYTLTENATHTSLYFTYIHTTHHVQIIVTPIAHFTYSPINPLVNETVTFNATLSTPNGGTIINYTWDFGDGFYGEGIITYHNYSETGTYNVTLTVIDSEGLNHTAWATVTVLIHDVTVVSVAPSTNEIYEGQTMNITVVVQNNGNFTETFNVTTYANTTIIQTLTVSDLAPANQTTLTFLWNTTGISLGNYTISAEASMVPGETYATDNVKVNGTVNVIPELASILLLFIVFLATTTVTISIKKRLLKKDAQRHSSIKISGYN